MTTPPPNIVITEMVHRSFVLKLVSEVGDACQVGTGLPDLIKLMEKLGMNNDEASVHLQKRQLVALFSGGCCGSGYPSIANGFLLVHWELVWGAHGGCAKNILKIRRGGTLKLKKLRLNSMVSLQRAWI